MIYILSTYHIYGLSWTYPLKSLSDFVQLADFHSWLILLWRFAINMMSRQKHFQVKAKDRGWLFVLKFSVIGLGLDLMSFTFIHWNFNFTQFPWKLKKEMILSKVLCNKDILTKKVEWLRLFRWDSYHRAHYQTSCDHYHPQCLLWWWHWEKGSTF